MELLEHTAIWAKGDLIQGRVMLFAGILLLIVSISIYLNDYTVLKGALIPFSIAILILIGYGGFLGFTRTAHAENVKTVFEKDPKLAVEQELEKAERDNRNYTVIKPIWIGLMIVTAILFLLFKTDYLKGLSIGLLVFFVTLLTVDVTLHHRLKPYLEVLRKLSE